MGVTDTDKEDGALTKSRNEEGVTDTGGGASPLTESRNTLAEIEERLSRRLGIDMSDEAVMKRRREIEAWNTAQICGKCGEPFGNGDRIYRHRADLAIKCATHSRNNGGRKSGR